ncbi:MAG: DUF3379 domain-containing protein [Gammaproteobacteria bacterium]|nr:DUF3379 domain-containing protein [Gammaproteobacteria bacterium]MDH5304489.1 DUF3379 domain-containing protein [Gammaproteobacteria bacterium]MDH5321968.1 DUF3379 domain-containing protein [Gammaproteobacteria bacterium]
MSAGDTTMNCDEYRQLVGADPNFDGGAGHRNECAACQAYRDEMRALDARIRQALLLEVPEFVPPALQGVAIENVVSLPARRRVTTPAWFALAASVALAAFVGLRFAGNAELSANELASEVLAHVTHEPDALRVTDVAVTDQHLGEVVPATIARMDHSAGLITFAETCPINGNDIPHLVIQGSSGPVTILLLPQEKVSGVIELDDGHRHGLILPVGNGSVAIIGTKDEQLEQIQQQVLKSVQWST